MRRLACYASFTLILPLAALGCSGEPSRYAASGAVTMDGAPAPFVVLKFHPVGGDPKLGGAGHTDDAGKFTIGEDGKNTGFPAGDYRVTFSQTLVKGKPTLAGSGGKAAEREKTEKEAVPDDYRNPEKTPVTATIGRGANAFTFDIKTGK
ncbi:hypothetical protein [Aquisphaera insulae]|uniref:hypothetical protein n=1 Tax=Aquisphaera insulae TaxID=2712864 RepID=UPI0013EBDD35|nr:hypothetical protein [Aquisphaera insulae]